MEEDIPQTPDPSRSKNKIKISFIDEESGSVPGNVPEQQDQSVPADVANLNVVLDEYEFIRTIGQGGMGTVYKAVQKSINRPVAIKILQKIENDEALRFSDRFQREVHVMAQMSHANIITVYSFGQTTDGQLFFVMEYVKGRDLSQIIKKGGISTDHIFKWIEQICDALFYAHSMGVIHRDIKPGNILITEKGDVKIADFGLAKLTGGGITDEHTRLTKTNMAMGTPDYVAPEILETGANVDHRVDIYAIGVMLYEMLTGKIPRGAWKPPSSLVEGLHRGFDEIVVKAMEPDQELRFSDAGEFSASLLQVRDEPEMAEFASPPQGPKMVTGSAALRKMVSPTIKKSVASAAPKVTSKPSSAKKKTVVKTKSAGFGAAWIGGAVLVAVVLLIVMIMRSNRKVSSPVVVSGGNKAVPIETVNAARDASLRKVAKWVFSKGGWITANYPGKQRGAGKITSEAELPKGKFNIVTFILKDCPVTNDELAIFKDVDQINFYNLSGTAIDDKGLAHLAHLRSVAIYIEKTRVTGESLAKFKSLKKLTIFGANETLFSDAGMEQLLRASQLKDLALQKTKITDAGITFLSGSKSLVKLDISGTAITSKGLDKLRGMTGLKQLVINDCPDISKESRLAFQKAHPKCKMVSLLKKTPASLVNIRSPSLGSKKMSGHTGYVNGLVLLPGSPLVAVSISGGSKTGDLTMRWWDVETGKETNRVDKVLASSLELSPDGKSLLITNWTGAEIRESTTGKVVSRFAFGESGVRTARFSPDSKQVALGGYNGRVVLYGVESKAPVWKLEPHYKNAVTDIAFIPGSKRIVVSYGAGKKNSPLPLRVFEVGKNEALFDIKSIMGLIPRLVTTADGSYLLAAKEGSFPQLFDLETGKLIRNYTGLKPFLGINSFVRALGFFDLDRYLFAGSNDGQLGIWEVESGRLVQKLKIGVATVTSNAAVSFKGGVMIHAGGSLKKGGGDHEIHVLPLPTEFKLGKASPPGKPGRVHVLKIVESKAYGADQIPEELGNEVVALSGAFRNVLALRKDGTVLGWGEHKNGGSRIMPKARDLVSIDSGLGACHGITRNGVALTWGPGQKPVRAVEGVKAVASGQFHWLLLKQDGTVTNYGAMNSGYNRPPKGLSDITAIAASSAVNLALKSNGTVVAWGKNDFGACDVPVGLKDVVQIACGPFQSFAVTRDGKVVTWGQGYVKTKSNGGAGQVILPPGLSSVARIVPGPLGRAAVQLKNGSWKFFGTDYDTALAERETQGATELIFSYSHILYIKPVL